MVDTKVPAIIFMLFIDMEEEIWLVNTLYEAKKKS